MAAARLHPLELRPALVELVVADGADVEPRAFIASIVGSSWNSAEVSGLAPIRSPADTVSVLRFRRWYSRREVARYAAPPAGMPAASVLSTLIVPGVVGSRFPWKSLSASSWSLTRPGDRTVT